MHHLAQGLFFYSCILPGIGEGSLHTNVLPTVSYVSPFDDSLRLTLVTCVDALVIRIG